MSALPQAPDTWDAPALSFRPMTVADLDAVLALEVRAYSHPWTRGNFTDSLASGYLAQMLMAPAEPAQRRAGRDTPQCLGYYLAMAGVDEMHLLNITVRPECQGQGLARRMLAHLMAASREAGAALLWLEVRQSNERAQRLYTRWGFESIGRRKAYYPAAAGQREDAIVMRLPLTGPLELAHGLD